VGLVNILLLNRPLQDNASLVRKPTVKLVLHPLCPAPVPLVWIDTISVEATARLVQIANV